MSDALNRPLALIRLAGLPLSLTLLSILSGSVINRVMVVELGLPVALAGLLLAIPLLISPVRIWLGHLSDAYPLGGRRREPYVILGALLISELLSFKRLRVGAARVMKEAWAGSGLNIGQINRSHPARAHQESRP